jgi:hypothetical protein
MYKNPADFRSEKLRLVHGVEATDNQELKISDAWEIKRLIKQFDDIVYEFQFGHPHQTCLSAIILKELTIDRFMLTKTPGIIIRSIGLYSCSWLTRWLTHWLTYLNLPYWEYLSSRW